MGATIRNEQYKLTVFENGRTWFADLTEDPAGERLIRSNQRTAEQDAAHDDLATQLDQWAESAEAPTNG